MKQKGNIKKKVMISEVCALGLPTPQPLYRHRFRYEDVSDHMFNVSNCPPPLNPQSPQNSVKTIQLHRVCIHHLQVHDIQPFI